MKLDANFPLRRPIADLTNHAHAGTSPEIEAKSSKRGKKGKKGKKTRRSKSTKAKPPVDKAEIKDTKPAAEAAPAAVDPLAEAKETDGFFKTYKKGNDVFFTVTPEQLNKPFFFSANTSKGVGEKRLVGSEMGDSYLAEFRQKGDRIQLVALHTENFATPDTPQEQFVEEGFADSIISSASLQKRESTGELVVNAKELLFRDIPDYQDRLMWAYKTPFGLDPNNTSITAVDNSAKQTSFGVETHYVAEPVPRGKLPTTTPVGGSALVEFRYNFLKLPETPMTPRVADERIGHFVTSRKDYTGDEGDGKIRMVNRWRLEKQDPDAAMSKPKEPITYWIAKDVPENYRKAVRAGIEEWNKAFEAIGYQDAIVVKQQKNTDTFDTLDARHASVRWYTAADVGSAVGPSHVDPRSGEILDADIRMADVFGRSAKRFFMNNVAENEHAHEHHSHEHDHGHHDHAHTHDGHVCHYQDHAAMEHSFARGLLEARGQAADAEKLAEAYVKDVVMHEVGHTLGFRHNFKGSTVFTAEQLQDADFTSRNGLGSSVMDYHPFNLAGPGEKQGEFVMSTLGAYDYLAVKYAYQEIDPAKEAETLNEIALQTTVDPLLIYETDEAADDMDPEVSRFDLGKNPLSFAQKQTVLAKELFNNIQTKELEEGESYKKLTDAFYAGLSKMSGAARLATRYVGGVHIRRDRAGTEHAIYNPVDASEQKKAVGFLMDSFFKPDSFGFKPEYVSRLVQNRFGNWGDQNIYAGETVLRTQTRVLNGLLGRNRARRMISNPEKLSAGEEHYGLGELYKTLQSTIWSELSSGDDISQGRRDLQREYLNSIASIVGPKSKHPGEAKSLLRYLGKQLRKDIDAAMTDGMKLNNLAHLEDCKTTLDNMLNPK